MQIHTGTIRIGVVDWQKLYQATNEENQPTPGYLFNEIICDVSNASPNDLPAVAKYLADCVDGDHVHVKLKALFVIKSLAYRVPPFCRCMQERLASVQAAVILTGPPSAIFGDEPYRLVREAAEGALMALTGGEHYHQQYREMSQRIVGFGNYQPAADTILPDGSVNLKHDFQFRDFALGTVNFITNSVGVIFGSMKEIFTNSFHQKQGLDIDYEEEDVEADPDGNENDNQDLTAHVDDDGMYHPSVGSYVPPTLPVPPQWTSTPVQSWRFVGPDLMEV